MLKIKIISLKCILQVQLFLIHNLYQLFFSLTFRLKFKISGYINNRHAVMTCDVNHEKERNNFSLLRRNSQVRSEVGDRIMIQDSLASFVPSELTDY